MAHRREASIIGSGPPTTVTPEFTGQIYYDTLNNKYYGSRSKTTGDWVLLGDMLKSIYDSDDDNLVDNAEQLNDGTNIVTSAEIRNHLDLPNAHDAVEIDTDTTNFDGELTVADTTVQAALDSIDDILVNKMNIDGSNSNVDVLYFKDNIPAPSYDEASVFYDSTEHALAVYNDSPSVTHQLGRELLLRVFNDSGNTILNGKPVYIDGADTLEGRPTVLLAQADTPVRSNVVGLATEDISDQSYGYITIKGSINGVDTSSFSSGDLLYLSDTVLGGMTNTMPSDDTLVVQLGHVLKSSVNGSIFVDLRHLGAVPITTTKTVFFRPERVGSYLNYKVKSLGQGGNDNFTFTIPTNFTNLVSLEMVYIPSSTISAGKTVNLTSSYAKIGELAGTNSESLPAVPISGTADTIELKDISGVYSNLQAGHICGLNWNNNNIGSTIYILGIRLRYS